MCCVIKSTCFSYENSKYDMETNNQKNKPKQPTTKEALENILILKHRNAENFLVCVNYSGFSEMKTIDM